MLAALADGDVGSLPKGSLHSVLLTLTEILQRAREVIDESIDASVASKTAAAA